MASIHKRENGTYYVRYRENGQNKSKSGFRTKKDANRWIMEKERGEVNTADVMFNPLVKEYIEYKKNSVRNTTIRAITRHLSKWKFGRISEITSFEIERQFYAMPLAYNTKKSALVILGSCLLYAKKKYGTPFVYDEVKVRNPVERPPNKEIITVEQFHHLLEIEKNEMNRLLYKLLFLSGVRIGEALALTRNDVHENYIDINKSTNEYCEISPTKTKNSNRKVFLPKEFIAELRAYNGHSDEYIFTSKKGKLINSTQISDILRVRGNAMGIRLTPHTFRHTCASYLISQGLPIPAVSKHLGHSSPAVTMNVYAHMIPTDDEKKIEILSNIFEKF